jgi:hypothetical protein
MNRAKPFLLSFVSGFLWAIIACYVAYSLSPTSWSHVARMLSGGIIAAPLIGVLIGMGSRRFSALGRLGQVLTALGDLHIAAFLFVWAAEVDTWRSILLGLTFSGYFLLLWPLSYVNHALVARTWQPVRPDDREQRDAVGGAGDEQRTR